MQHLDLAGVSALKDVGSKHWPGVSRKITNPAFVYVAMAHDAIWIMVASVLTAYDISEAVDMDGRKRAC